MAAYAALAHHIRLFSLILNNCDVVLPPRSLEASKFLLKELISFRDFVERLDSKKRKRMNASLQQIAEAVRKSGISGFTFRHEPEYITSARGTDAFVETQLQLDKEHEDFVRATDSLVEQFQKVKEEYKNLLQEAEQGIASSSSSSRVVSKSKMVGLRDKWRLLKDDLIVPYSNSTIYLLSGMAGIGKTALAREIFEDLDILDWFDCCAWVTVGTEWKSEEITEAILAQVPPEAHKMIMGGSKKKMGEGLMDRLKGKITDGSKKKMGEGLMDRLKGKITGGSKKKMGEGLMKRLKGKIMGGPKEEVEERLKEMIKGIMGGPKEEINERLKEMLKGIMGGPEEEIDERLKEMLKGKRYLIVLDDVWNADVHEYLERSLPDNENGSRVLLTSRMKYVGIRATNQIHHIYMRLLNKEESWDLLREKVFAGERCPPHLVDAGKKIAEKCDGLPLTILIIAGFLSKAEESIWMDVAVKKKHQFFINAYDQISEVLYPSYNTLLDQLKMSFLYMGAFLLKYEIPKSRLINLWVAEDLVEPNELGTLEDTASFFLRQFELSNLVLVCQRDITSSIQDSSILEMFSGHVKSCRLHSTWWYFCQIEARKTNLFHVLDCYNKDSIEGGLEGQNRLSIHSNVLFAIKHVHYSIEKICASTVHTLLCFGPYCQYMVPVCFGLKFLCRLDALNIRFYDFPLEVLKLVKLRYLALTCNRSLPPSISDLKNLQYLIVHPHLSIKLLGYLSYMPVEIWDLEELKHLEVMGCDLAYFGEKTLQKLATLSHVTTRSCGILDRVPNLAKLRITIELTPDAADPLCCFDHISVLTKLEKLTCVIVNPEWKLEGVSPVYPFPCLPLSLTKLSLSGLGYHWEEMSKIALLPNLKVLKLQCNAFQGPKWKVKENGFPHLSALLIEDIDLVKLEWGHGSFKSLHVLSINHCFKLNELYLGNTSSITNVEVIDCSPSVEYHVKNNLLRLGCLTAKVSVCSSWRP